MAVAESTLLQGCIAAALASPGRSQQATAQPGVPHATQAASLAELAKIALGLELDCSETALQLARHLAAMRWRASAAAVMRPAGAKVSGTPHHMLPGPLSCCSSGALYSQPLHEL